MRRLFTKINHTLKKAKHITNDIKENNQFESCGISKFSALINPEDENILNQRNENLKYIFNTLMKYEVKLDPHSVGDIYRYHMLRQEVESSYNVPPELSKAADIILQDNMDAEGQAQLIGKVNTIDINMSVNK